MWQYTSVLSNALHCTIDTRIQRSVLYCTILYCEVSAPDFCTWQSGLSPCGDVDSCPSRKCREHIVQCSAVQCSAVQCSALQCNAVQYSAMQCSVVQCSDVHCPSQQCGRVQYRRVHCLLCAVQYSPAYYNAVQQTVQCGAVQQSVQCSIQYSAVQQSGSPGVYMSYCV